MVKYMTPEEKALKLVHDMYFAYFEVSMAQAKQCALIAVDEIIPVIDAETNYKTWEFYKQVKQEIEKL